MVTKTEKPISTIIAVSARKVFLRSFTVIASKTLDRGY